MIKRALVWVSNQVDFKNRLANLKIKVKGKKMKTIPEKCQSCSLVSYKQLPRDCNGGKTCMHEKREKAWNEHECLKCDSNQLLLCLAKHSECLDDKENDIPF